MANHNLKILRYTYKQRYRVCLSTLQIKVRFLFPVGECVRSVLDFVLAVLIIALSIPVVQNLLSSRQAMNTSFDSFRLVNTYGAFGRCQSFFVCFVFYCLCSQLCIVFGKFQSQSDVKQVFKFNNKNIEMVWGDVDLASLLLTLIRYLAQGALRENFLNKEFFLVSNFPHSD